MVRYLEHNEKENSRPLYEHCFHDSKVYTDYYYEKCMPNNYVAVNEVDGEIVSAMHLIPKTAVVGKLKTNLMYIYGVGTKDIYRQKGYMKDMFVQVLHDMHEDMEPFTYLIPSDDSNAEIYRKLGFEFVMDKPKIKPEEIRKKPTHSLISRRADFSDLNRLAIFAKSINEKNYKVTLAKDIEYFRHMKELTEIEGGYIDIYIENKVIVGYRIWIDDEILEEVLDPSIQTMSWNEPKGIPYVMARVLSVRKTLRLLDFKGYGEIKLKIEDPVIAENHGCFELSYAHGNIKMNKLKDDVKCELEVTIGELTAHVFGYKLIEGLPVVSKEPSFFINDYV